VVNWLSGLITFDRLKQRPAKPSWPALSKKKSPELVTPGFKSEIVGAHLELRLSIFAKSNARAIFHFCPGGTRSHLGNFPQGISLEARSVTDPIFIVCDQPG
jgi:hypothetical protein